MEGLLSIIHAHAIPVSAAILIVAYVFIATEKIPKVTVALLGAALTLILGLLGQDKLVNGTFDVGYFINFVDFNVIFLLVSMMIIVSIATRSGMFNWIANEMLKMTKGKPKLILISLAFFTAIVSAFLDNVTTVILIMPVTLVIAKELDINAIPFLITEFVASNPKIQGLVVRKNSMDLKNGSSLSCGCLRSSYGEILIKNILINNQIDFKKEYSFNDLLSEKNIPLRFDFAIFKDGKLSHLIEYDGEQHFSNKGDNKLWSDSFEKR